ncbi:uncharacterized protein LOC115238285 [Formica exsecta]|uniref:uncharacterized protein LOC115238285 n=1 Tax=Formica exsecta TaxID=72781 RepID=UPI001141C52C|nr:uncharacterized protein LOC115238285 [Formica exsecta]
MSYLLLRIADGWITNSDGDFYVEDTEQKCRMWIPNNLIGFHENNEAYFKNQGSDNNVKRTIKIIDISHEFKETIINEVENSYENSFQSERTSNVIEVENVDATKTKEKRNTWSVNETCALIGAVEARYDDMHHVHKRKNFWSVISEELSSQNIEVSFQIGMQKKWQNLVRTYKNTKDVQSKTGRGPVKFTFYNRLDELLGDSPSSASTHSLDVDELQSQDTQVEPTLNFDSDTSSERPSYSNDSSCTQKRKNPLMELVKVKKKFFEEKMEKIKEKEISRKLYVEESLKYKKEKLDLYKEKLEMEKKKIKALEDLQKILKEKIT